MNQTGVRSTGSRRQARTRRGSRHASYTSAVPGPLVARWRSWSLDPPRAGALTTARAEVENAGAATWGADIAASYHWLDERGNAIVWDGIRTRFPGRSAPASASRSRSPCARRCRRRATASRSTSSPSTAPGSASSADNDTPSEAVDVLPRVAATALRDVATVHAPRRRPNGRAACWRSTPRGTPSSRVRSTPRAASASGSRRGRPAPAASPASRSRCSARPCCTASSSSGSPTSRGSPAFRPPADEPWVYDASLVLELG